MLALAFGALAESAQLVPPPMQAISWQKQTLDYQGSKFFITLRTGIEHSRLQREAVSRALRAPTDPGSPARTAPEAGVRTVVNTEILGRETRLDLLMSEAGSALQVWTLRTNYKPRYRLYRYLEEGVYSLRQYPENDQEAGQAHDSWGRRSEDRFPLEDAYHRQWITEPESLLYLVPAIDWSAVEGAIELPMFDKDGIIQLRLEAVGKERIEVEFNYSDSLGNRQFEERKIQALKILATPIVPDHSDAEFEFLGNKGPLELHIDPERQLLMQLKGNAEIVGEVVIRLTKATIEYPEEAAPAADAATSGAGTASE